MIPLVVSPGGLFNRFGVLGGMGGDLALFASETVTVDIQDILTQFATDAEGPSGSGQSISAQLAQQQNSIRSAISSSTAILTSMASGIANLMVYIDNPLFTASTIKVSVQEIIRQMLLNGQTVQACTITCTASQFDSVANTGNGQVVTSVKRQDGLIQQNAFAETQSLVCIADAQPGGGATAGRERWQWRGELAASSVWDWTWPLGSGANAQTTTINAASYNDGLNVLVNGDFQNYTTPNAPDNWTIKQGAAGTQILESTVTFYTGDSSLEFVGDSLTGTEIQQQFASSTGSSFTPQPEQQFAVNGWFFLSNVPASGVLEISIVDGNDAVVKDTQGVNNTFTINLHAALSTTWTNFNGVFRTPNLMPLTGIYLRIKLTVPLSAGTNLFIAQVAMGQMTRLYLGGPSLSVFAGSVNFVSGSQYPGYSVSPPDQFNISVTNNRGGRANNATMQTVWDRLLGMRQPMDLILPYSNTPTISDSLIMGDYPPVVSSSSSSSH